MSHQHPMHEPARLTKNQALVFGAISHADVPLSAYTILDGLRREGFRAPLQVYRALEKLLELGMVHRLESLNAFVACQQNNCASHSIVAFAICDTCGKVAEIADETLPVHLDNLAKNHHFGLKKSTVELRGICENCQAA
jgi:Fur family transcriptional regulator, zinc uptake regulator